MERRDFLLGGLLATGMLSAGAAAPPQGTEIIDGFCHFSFLKVIDYLEANGGPKPHVYRKLFRNTPPLSIPRSGCA